MKKSVLPSGLHMINPLMEIVEVDIRTMNYTMSGMSEHMFHLDPSDDNPVLLSIQAPALNVQINVNATPMSETEFAVELTIDGKAEFAKSSKVSATSAGRPPSSATSKSIFGP